MLLDVPIHVQEVVLIPVLLGVLEHVREVVLVVVTEDVAEDVQAVVNRVAVLLVLRLVLLLAAEHVLLNVMVLQLQQNNK